MLAMLVVRSFAGGEVEAEVEMRAKVKTDTASPWYAHIRGYLGYDRHRPYHVKVPFLLL